MRCTEESGRLTMTAGVTNQLGQALQDVGDAQVRAVPGGESERLVSVNLGLFQITFDDVDTTYRRALQAGAVVVEAPLDTPYGDRRATVRDSYGNVYQIARRTGRTTA
jgi:PhnB protein